MALTCSLSRTPPPGMVAVYACRRFVRPLASLGFWNCAIGSVAAAACIAALCHGIVWGATSLTALAVLSFCVLSFPGWIAIQVGRCGHSDSPLPPPALRPRVLVWGIAAKERERRTGASNIAGR